MADAKQTNPKLVPSEPLAKELVVNAGTVLVHLVEKYEQLDGKERNLPSCFVQAWARFGDRLTDGSTEQFQAFADAASLCPPQLTETLIRISEKLDLIPSAMATQLIASLALQNNNRPKGGLHG